jgi:hypothetical protein
VEDNENENFTTVAGFVRLLIEMERLCSICVGQALHTTIRNRLQGFGSSHNFLSTCRGQQVGVGEKKVMMKKMN